MPATTTRRYAPLKEAAEYSQVTVKTLRNWIIAGRITGYRRGPKLIFVDLGELDAMVRPIPAARAAVR
jgi:excisionase family DNA binding protein